MTSPLFDEGMTVVRTGPKDTKPDDAVVCYECGGTEWAEDRAYDWKRGDTGRRTIRNALTLRCVKCGRHRRGA